VTIIDPVLVEEERVSAMSEYYLAIRQALEAFKGAVKPP